MIQTVSQKLEACEKQPRIDFRGHAKANGDDACLRRKCDEEAENSAGSTGHPLIKQVWQRLLPATLAHIILR